MEKIMIDTSAIYALLDRSHKMHNEAKICLRILAKKGIKIVITNFIRAECHTLIAGNLGRDLARYWLENMHWPIERVSAEDEKRAQGIILSSKEPYSYIDATTFAVMERLNINAAFAFDSHFPQYGFILLNGLENNYGG